MKPKKGFIQIITCFAASILSACYTAEGSDPTPVSLSGQFQYMDEVVPKDPIIITHDLTGRGGYFHYRTPALAGSSTIEPDGTWSFSGSLCPHTSLDTRQTSFGIWNISAVNLDDINFIESGSNWKLNRNDVTVSLRNGVVTIEGINFVQVGVAHERFSENYEEERQIEFMNPELRCLDD